MATELDRTNLTVLACHILKPMLLMGDFWWAKDLVAQNLVAHSKLSLFLPSHFVNLPNVANYQSRSYLTMKVS